MLLNEMKVNKQYVVDWKGRVRGEGENEEVEDGRWKAHTEF